MLNAVPNPAHQALARLTVPQLRSKLMPDASFTWITQNIDGLDRRAVEQAYSDAGLPNPLDDTENSTEPLLLEMHGHVAGVLCTDYECRYRTFNFDMPICPSLTGTELIVEARPKPVQQPQSADSGRKRTAAEARAWAEARLAGFPHETDSDGEPDIATSDLPRCSKCRSLLRPDIVWFTEVPHHIEEVMRVVESADLIMVIGTSAIVCALLNQST